MSAWRGPRCTSGARPRHSASEADFAFTPCRSSIYLALHHAPQTSQPRRSPHLQRPSLVPLYAKHHHGADRCRTRHRVQLGPSDSAAMGPAVARAWRADTGHVRNGARAVPTMRPEILARPPQPRPLLLRPLRRPRSPRQVCDDPRRSASGGPARPQVRGLRRADRGREVDEAVLLDTLPGRRASCWRLDGSGFSSGAAPRLAFGAGRDYLKNQPDRAPRHFESARAVGGSRLLSPCQARAGTAAALCVIK
jgi:hypothetical protein